MFDSVAGVYDLLNTAMSAGLHHHWRSRAADLARVGLGDRVLDVATGTGDLAFELAGRVGPGGEVIGSDFSEAMLDHAREKAAAREGRSGAAVRPRFEWGDALELPYPSGMFDVATSGFSVRNFADLGLGLAEMVRVVRPGGRVVVIEFTTPRRPPLSTFYALWFDRLVPLLGRLAELTTQTLAPLLTARPRAKAGARHNGAGSSTNDASNGVGGMAAAYTYLPNSVKRFPGPLELAAEFERAGLTEISYVLLAGGIVAIHAGTVPHTAGR
jgi:demethylmenaquinone methyltransferase/2-methoxy-6-polyprenyl-1,4-benzoquinol methylase